MYKVNEKIDIVKDVFNQIHLGKNSIREVFKKSNLNKPKINQDTFYEWIKKDEYINKIYKELKNNPDYIKKIKCKANPKNSKANNINDYRVLNARKVNKIRNKINYIYIIKIINQNIYKIGVSNNYKRRFRDISSCLPYESEVIFAEIIENAYNIEEVIHNSIKDYYLKSEWFKLDSEQIKDIINYLNIIKDGTTK